MLPTERLNRLGQSLWLDDITRDLLDSGTLERYIAEWSVTGLTSNPTIFDHAITHSASYDGEIARLLSAGLSGEDLFFSLAIQDLSRAADLFLPIHQRTATVDGWVSLEVSPLLAHDTAGTVASAQKLHATAGKPNLFIKIPGTREGLPAIEQAIFAGIPVNVTLLFSAGAICGGGGCLYERARAAGRCRTVARHSVRRIALHLALGPRGGRQGPSPPQEPSWPCYR